MCCCLFSETSNFLEVYKLVVNFGQKQLSIMMLRHFKGHRKTKKGSKGSKILGGFVHETN